MSRWFLDKRAKGEQLFPEGFHYRWRSERRVERPYHLSTVAIIHLCLRDMFHSPKSDDPIQRGMAFNPRWWADYWNAVARSSLMQPRFSGRCNFVRLTAWRMQRRMEKWMETRRLACLDIATRVPRICLIALLLLDLAFTEDFPTRTRAIVSRRFCFSWVKMGKIKSQTGRSLAQAGKVGWIGDTVQHTTGVFVVGNGSLTRSRKNCLTVLLLWILGSGRVNLNVRDR